MQRAALWPSLSNTCLCADLGADGRAPHGPIRRSTPSFDAGDVHSRDLNRGDRSASKNIGLLLLIGDTWSRSMHARTSATSPASAGWIVPALLFGVVARWLRNSENKAREVFHLTGWGHPKDSSVRGTGCRRAPDSGNIVLLHISFSSMSYAPTHFRCDLRQLSTLHVLMACP